MECKSWLLMLNLPPLSGVMLSVHTSNFAIVFPLLFSLLMSPLLRPIKVVNLILLIFGYGDVNILSSSLLNYAQKGDLIVLKLFLLVTMIIRLVGMFGTWRDPIIFCKMLFSMNLFLDISHLYALPLKLLSYHSHLILSIPKYVLLVVKLLQTLFMPMILLWKLVIHNMSLGQMLSLLGVIHPFHS